MKPLYISSKAIGNISYAHISPPSARKLSAKAQWSFCTSHQESPNCSILLPPSRELHTTSKNEEPKALENHLEGVETRIRRVIPRTFVERNGIYWKSLRNVLIAPNHTKNPRSHGSTTGLFRPLLVQARRKKNSISGADNVRSKRALRSSNHWATRIASQLDPTIKLPPKRVEVEQLLTRAERLRLPEPATALREVLEFAEAIKANPWTPEELGIEEVFKEKEEKSSKTRDFATSGTLFKTTTGRNLSNYCILAGYIDLILRKPILSAEQYDKLMLEVFSDEALRWLGENGGYTVEDIVTWAWILEADSDYMAVKRFLVWTNRPMPHQRVPRYIYLMLLKRYPTEPAVVQMLTTHLAHRLANTIDNHWETVYTRFRNGQASQTFSEIAQDTETKKANYLVVRTWNKAVYMLLLMKFAMYSMPILLPSLATMMCKHIQPLRTRSEFREDGLSFQSSVNLTLVFNKAIAMMAAKSAEPYIDVPYQERGQFIVIRHMNTFNPPLTIGLDAYRAIVSVQLRHRKTIKERLWTELKSRGWPPYREDKLGIDALKKDEEYGVSRAQRAIINLKEAGYAPTVWEDSASVLSGWDVNRAPTIQSRQLFLARARIKKKAEIEIQHRSLWQTRILATRTIEEAWAVFLNFLEEDLPRASVVFLAMFEKIIQERERIKRLGQRNGAASLTALAGDMSETMPSSPNPREQVYIPSPPPSFTTFYQRYRTYFPVLDTEALCFLLPHAESLAQGYEFVKKSRLMLIQKDILLRESLLDRDEIPIESRIVVAYIRMLSNFASEALPNHQNVSALSHAIHLVVSRKPRSRGPWRSLLEAVESEICRAQSKSMWLQHWHITLGIIKKMERAKVFQDSQIFYVLCSLFTRLVRLAPASSSEGNHYSKTPSFESASEIKIRTAKMLKTIFRRMVTLDLRTVFCHTEKEFPFLPLEKPKVFGFDKSVEFRIANLLPHLLYIPGPPAIHLFVRLLGVVEDRKAVFDLVRWMSIYHREIEAKATELANGAKQFRNVLIAVRIIMECEGVPFMTSETLKPSVELDLDLAEKIKQIVDSVGTWGGWPTDEEVEEYKRYGMNLPDSDEAVE